ncbi:MAG TPA: efflux RND transporter periplasmic adaptor subunit [Steroidobacteraceae bacterium]|jgi:RND family efflux transporter MFP subunit|nr:efflux RND transporter periplasmic adaptor subunit [Steroidobacteraceae bacterium]
MDDKSALLNQLRINREGEPRSVRWPLWLAAAAAILVVGAAIWYWQRPAGVPIHVAVAEAAGGAAAGPASILDASGYVVARRQATVASKITGKMVELDIEEGDHVKEGQVIARLDDTNALAAVNAARAQLDYAKAGLEETEVNLANAKRDYERQKSLLGGHFVSQSAVDNAQTAMEALAARLATQRSNIEVAQRNIDVAQRSLDDTVVRAPFSGVVTVKAAQPGEIVSPMSAGGGFTRTGIGTIVDMASLEIQVDVNENFINRVEPRQKVTAKLNAYPDWQIPGHVIAVIPTADRSKGTVTVRIALDRQDPRILPEMGVRVAFLSEAPGTATTSAAPANGASATLPAAAVQVSGATGVVYVVHDSTVERRAVRIGAAEAGQVTVLAGVEPGEPVALGDFTKLRDGAAVRIER